jgi:Uma2 family endonuclease
MLMTPDEFDAVTDWDDRFTYELVQGIVIVSPPVAASERGPNEELGRWLLDYRDTHPQGSILVETLPEEYVPTPNSRRRADRVIWVGVDHIPDPAVDFPAIIVEFVSRSRRDRHRDYVVKRADYLGMGASEYWVFDRFQRTMTVFRRPPDEPVEQVIRETDIYRTRLLPGFEVPLKRLLILADKWDRTR